MLTMYDAITGTIMQITGNIPCMVGGFKIMKHHRKQLNNNVDNHVYFVQDSYRYSYRVVFRVVLNDNGEITRFVPIFAKRLCK